MVHGFFSHDNFSNVIQSNIYVPDIKAYREKTCTIPANALYM